MKTIIAVRQVFRNIRNQMILAENLYSDIDIEPGKEYVIDVREAKSKRTIQQNKYMWALIHQIANHENVRQPESEVYSLILEDANAKYIYLLGTPEAENELRKNFRAVRIVRPTTEKGKEYYVYKCFIGTSKMNTAEMNEVLDITIAWADELGIETSEEYYSR